MSTTMTPTLTGHYTLDPAHSRLGFVARHAMVTKVRGAFPSARGEGYLDADTPSQSTIRLEIDVASVDTGNADRDAHLRTNDFFEVETYPTITFESTKVVHELDQTYRVTGDLTIKGVTRSITFDLEVTGTATDPFGNDRLGLEGSVQVNRKDWGLSWNATLDAGGVLVSDKVTLEFDISAIKAKD